MPQKPVTKGSLPTKAPRTSRFLDRASADMPSDPPTTPNPTVLYQSVASYFKNANLQALSGKPMKDKLSRLLRDKSIIERDMNAFSNYLKQTKDGPAGSKRETSRDNVKISIKEILVSYIHTNIKLASENIDFA